MKCGVLKCDSPAYGNYLFCSHHISEKPLEHLHVKDQGTPLAGHKIRVDAEKIVVGFCTMPDYSQKPSLALLYPKYYKAVPKGWEFLDTYAVNILFPVDDPSGCILHARKKLLVPGVRSGGKSMRKDITEARDTLNRWLELNPE